jgi:hypothetical protein
MKKRIPHVGFLIVVTVFPFACATTAPPSNSTSAPVAPVDTKAASESIKSDELLAHIKTLASDEFEGRAPGTKGEELTVNYLTEQLWRWNRGSRMQRQKNSSPPRGKTSMR